ncbi:MAG: exodeoxyribonuclease V subunit gamma, partial [Planctomycetota bacterium]
MATALVDCFERYASYRPVETLQAWAAGLEGPHDTDAPWQSELWRALLAAGCGDPLADQAALLAALRSDGGELPARIYAVGFNNMAPALLEQLAVLAERCVVHVACLQPTWGYWGEDQRSLRELVRAGVPAADWGNRLLGDWGRVGRDFLRALDEAGADYQADPEAFPPPRGSGLLQRLQRDLAAAASPTEAGVHRLDAVDYSLQVHACHSLRRQLEVTKAAIHRACAADPELRPHDIAVMTPDPAAVAPMAAALFAGHDHGPPIAVAVADRSPRQLDPAAAVLLRLLDLLPGRFTAGEVLDFLGNAPVAAAWSLGADELDRLRDWIDRADLRWGVDAAHRQEELGHAYAAGAWLHGLQRLQLAWWFGPDADAAQVFTVPDADPAEAVVPVADLQPDAADALARLTRLLQPLLASAADCRRAQSPAWWQERLVRLLQHVLQCTADDPALAEVVAGLAAWRAGLEALDWRQGLDAGLVAAVFGDRYGQAGGGDFGRGAVTVCGMQPMRSVPFRMLCLVGMDDGAFPREQCTPDFDLLRRHPRPGDRDARAEDRYLLLEMLTAVRDRLCIAYQGFDAREQTALPPALPVGELLDVAAATCGLSPAAARARLVVEHRLHAGLDADAYWPSPLQRDEHRALLGSRAATGPIDADLPPDPDPLRIDLAELVAFWRSPGRAWLRRLGVALPDLVAPPRDHECLAPLRGLERYQAAERLLGVERPEAFSLRLAAEGRLPPGALGRHAWQGLHRRIAALHARCRALAPDCSPAEWECGLADATVQGACALLHPGLGLLLVHPGTAGPGVQLALWLQVLAAAAAGVTDRGTCLYCSGDADVGELQAQAPADAGGLLGDLVAGLRSGRRRPLPVALRSSHAYAAARWSGRRRLDHDA